MNESSLFDLSGGMALVAGSSAGIGFALAQGLGHAGAKVVLNGHAPGRIKLAAERLRREGVSVHETAFDVTDSRLSRHPLKGARTRSAPLTS